MKRLLVLPLALVLALPLVADEKKKAPPADPDVTKVVAGNTKFAVSLYGQLRQKEGNLFCSPYSISTALAMTSAGARNNTLTQMEKAMHFPAQKVLHAGTGRVMKQLKGGGKTAKYELAVANALWGQADHKFLDDFLALNKKHY